MISHEGSGDVDLPLDGHGALPRHTNAILPVRSQEINAYKGSADDSSQEFGFGVNQHRICNSKHLCTRRLVAKSDALQFHMRKHVHDVGMHVDGPQNVPSNLRKKDFTA